MAPSELTIATNALKRYAAEAKDYDRELDVAGAEEKKLEALHKDDPNQQFVLQQQQKATVETRKALTVVKEKLAEAISNLQNVLSSKPDHPPAEVEKANDTIRNAQAVKAGLKN